MIDPIDKANAILDFFQSRHEGMDRETIISALLNYDRDPQRIKNEITETVSVIIRYVGMTTRTIENILSLLRLPKEIRDAVKTGRSPSPRGTSWLPISKARGS